MDGNDRVPFRFTHIREHSVPQDSGIVDQHVETAIRLDRGLHQSLGSVPGGYVIAVVNRFSVKRPDLFHDRPSDTLR